MADAFEFLKSSLNRGITTISVKTSSTIEKTKIKARIDAINRDIDKNFATIGETAYKTWTEGSEDFTVLNSLFEAIKTKREEIERLKEEIQAIDERDSQILGNAEAPEVQPLQLPQQNLVCPGCGEVYDEPVKFCRKCGNRVSV